VKFRDVIRIIEANGFVLARHHGTSHRQYRGNVGGQVRYIHNHRLPLGGRRRETQDLGFNHSAVRLA
jgi:hypothetical protein